MVTLVAEALFALVFARVLVTWVRRRDPLQRDVAVMLSAMAVLFLLAVARQTLGEPPRFMADAATVLLVGQPFLTLHLARQVGRVPGVVFWSALAGWLGSATLLLAAPDATPGPVVAAVVLLFVVTEVAAAGFLGWQARSRTGAPRTRLWLATAATVLFAAAILAAGSGAGDPDGARAARQTGQVLALLSAVGYLMAFTPPGWLRRTWSGRAAYELVRRLLGIPADQPPAVLWQRYVETVCQATGSSAAVVLAEAPDGGIRQMAGVGVPADIVVDWSAVGNRLPAASVTSRVDDERPGGAMPVEVRAYAHAANARFVTMVPLDMPAGRGVLLLLNRYRSLFTEDDARLFGELGAQAAALVQRAELLADRNRLTGELSASVTALQAASQAKSNFMANMSHELRTPLNAVMGFSDLMRGEPSTGDRTAVPSEWIGHIHSSGQHLLGLINEVLDLAKIESGNVELRRERLDLRDVVGEVVAGLEPLSKRKRIEITMAVPPLRVHADRLRLRQITTNLLSNAIKFTPDRGNVYVAGRRVAGEIALSVADTGPGIAPEDQQRVYEEFQQVGDEHARAGGTGLGLALTRRLVQAHGGRIELESEPGHGAKFMVHLPAVSAIEPTLVDPSTGSCASVLIIEDDPAGGRLLSSYLDTAGYQVTVAATGEEGLARARQGHPELILLDIQLPGMDGWQVLAELKHDERLQHIPVVIISAHDEARVGLALGAVDYFVKPVDRHTLLAWLARHGLIPPMGGQLTVLAIDDDPHSLDIIHTTLKAQGILVVRAAGGADGLRLARSRPYDLIICDLIMPDLDGFDVVAALHADPATRHIPVIVLTAHTLTDADKARLNGKVISIAGKDGTTDRLAALVHTVGELTGLRIDASELVA